MQLAPHLISEQSTDEEGDTVETYDAQPCPNLSMQTPSAGPAHPNIKLT
jgi:hypothetical protein